MIPILFSKSATSFSTNGIGRLTDCISCTVTEERNGIFELQMEYPANGLYFDQIELGSIIAAKPYDEGTRQAFRVYLISKPLNKKVTIYANHISYDLSYIPVQPFNATGINAVLTGIKNNSQETNDFTFITDITNTTTAYQQAIPKSVRACLGGTDGSVLDVFSGSGGIEFLWDNYTVNVLRNRGSNKGFQLRYGKNITGMDMKQDITDVFTGVYPYWTNEDNSIVAIGQIQYSPYASLYPINRVIPLDLSEEFEDTPTPTELNTAAAQVVNASGVGIAKNNISVNFITLEKTDNYKELAPLEKVQLCDTVTVIVPELGVNYSAKVIKTEYDVLRERYNSIVIGDAQSTITKTLAANFNDLASVVNTQNKIISFNQQIDVELGQFQQTITEINNNADSLQSQITQNKSNITTTVGRVTTLENNAGTYATKTEVEQTESGIRTTISSIQAKQNELTATQDELAEYITIDQDLNGITIGKNTSDIRGQFTNDSLNFLNANDVLLAWLSASEGLGAIKLSVGNAITKNQRWNITTSTDGSHLRFTRHD